MNKKAYILSCFLTALLLIPGPGGKQALLAHRAISLQECREAARRSHSVSEQMELLESAGRAGQDILRKLITPEIIGFATASYQSDVTRFTAEDGFAADFSPMVKDQYRTGIYAQQLIYDGGVYRQRSALAETEKNLREASLERQQRMIENGVDELFLQAILLNKGHQILFNQKDILKNRQKQLEALYEEGKVFRVELLEAEAALIRIGAEIKELQASEEKVRAMLSTLTGIPVNPEDSLILPEGEANDTRKEDPLFRQLRLEMERSTLSEKLSRSAAMPNIQAAGSVGYARPGLNLFSSDFDTYWVVGLSLSIPITDWRDHRKQSGLFAIERDQLGIRYDNLRREEELRLRELEGEIIKYDQLIQEDEKLIEKHRQIREEYEAMHDEGAASMTDLLQALSEESGAKLRKAGHQIEKIRISLQRNKVIIREHK